MLAVNGEIYNHTQLREGLSFDFTSGSDCEVINALYREGGSEFLSRINGIFAFALWDRAAQRYLIARDPFGVCPLYWGHDDAGRLHVASEMKALVDTCADVAAFPPGHVYDSRDGALRRWYHKPWREHAATRGRAVSPADLRQALEQAVHRQLMSDVPYGVLLSGGLDSSLVAALRRSTRARESRTVIAAKPGGHGCIPLPLALKAHPTWWRPSVLPGPSALCITVSSTACRRAWMPFPR